MLRLDSASADKAPLTACFVAQVEKEPVDPPSAVGLAELPFDIATESEAIFELA